jgi:predicted small lipoprotein YifL
MPMTENATHARTMAVIRLATACALALTVAGCGIKSGLESPAAKGTATADSGQGKPEGAAPKPHQGFILDGLLR